MICCLNLLCPHFEIELWTCNLVDMRTDNYVTELKYIELQTEFKIRSHIFALKSIRSQISFTHINIYSFNLYIIILVFNNNTFNLKYLLNNNLQYILK